jgi:hypothetical protein
MKVGYIPRSRSSVRLNLKGLNNEYQHSSAQRPKIIEGSRDRPFLAQEFAAIGEPQSSYREDGPMLSNNYPRLLCKIDHFSSAGCRMIGHQGQPKVT